MPNRNLMIAEPDTLVADGSFHTVIFTYSEHKDAHSGRKIKSWQDGILSRSKYVTSTEAKVEVMASSSFEGPAEFEILGTKLVGYVIFK